MCYYRVKVVIVLKANRFLMPLISVFLCLILCSCGNKFIYQNDQKINFNYNNISAGACLYWIDESGVYFKQHDFLFNICRLDENGKTKLSSVDDSCSRIQVYGNDMYYYDSAILDNIYHFFKYDLSKDKKKKIATVKSKWIYDYLILDNSIFVVEGFDESLVKNLSVVSLKTGEKTEIEQNILGFGVYNGALHYATERGGVCTIYRYDSVKTEVASFSINGMNADKIYGINFANDSVLLFELFAPNITIYDFKTETVSSYPTRNPVDELIAFENSAFYICGDDETDTLYCLNLDTKETVKIQDFEAGIDLFVASDENAYVCFPSSDSEKIQRYSIDGKFEDIIIDKKAR